MFQLQIWPGRGGRGGRGKRCPVAAARDIFGRVSLHTDPLQHSLQWGRFLFEHRKGAVLAAVRLRHGDALKRGAAAARQPSGPLESRRVAGRNSFFQPEWFSCGCLCRPPPLSNARRGPSLSGEKGRSGRRLLLRWKKCVGHFLLLPPRTPHPHSPPPGAQLPVLLEVRCC